MEININTKNAIPANKTTKTHQVQTNFGLKKDTFEKQKTTEEEATKMNEFSEEDRDNNERFVTTKEDVASMRAFSYSFYPEDIEKMKAMSPDEKKEYRKKMIKEKRIIIK